MTKPVHHFAAALAIGFGLTIAAPVTASAQDAPGIRAVEGTHIATRARGRVGYYGGPRRHYGGPRRYSGRGIAAGVAAGIAGAIILNEVTRSRPAYADDGLSCGQLEYRCSNGQDWACRRLDRDPNC